MPSHNDNSVDFQSIRKQLARFSRLELPPDLTTTERAELRAALQIFNEAADYQTLGICGDTLAQAKTAAESYVAALSCPIRLDLDAREGPVYLKFNTLNGAWYLDDYPGSSRGVLISFHASEPEADAVNGTYGPFPMDLYS